MCKKEEASICLKCLHLSSQVVGLRDRDAVVCMSCQSVAGFTIIYPKLTTVDMKFTGVDIDGVSVYKPVSITGSFKAGLKPQAIKCKHCNKKIAFWIATSNKYVQSFFPENSNSEL